MAVVVDVSATMAWCFADETSEASRQLWSRVNGEGIVVPQLWPVEVASVLLTAERRKRVTPAQSDEFLGILGHLLIEVEARPCEDWWEALIPLARSTGLTAYDAAYVELAERRGLSLATRDDRMLAVARARGVTLVAA